MPSIPTQRDPGSQKLVDQEPAPPISRDDALTIARRNPVFERQNWTSNNYNSVQQTVRVYAEWVMEEEVADTTHRFLRYPTRRCFIEDRVQVRVQLHSFVLTGAAKISVTLFANSAPNEYALILSTDNGFVNTMVNRGLKAVHRPLTLSANLSQETGQQTEAGIYYETDPGSQRSYIATTVMIPPGANPDTSPGETYIAEVEIIDQGRFLKGRTPPIEAVRFWADPDQNLVIPRTDATTILPLIDGVDYFQCCCDVISAAGAGDNVYIAGWSFNPLTLVTGGQAAAQNGAGAGNWVGALQDTLAAKIETAYLAGANIYILLDEHNAFIGRRVVARLEASNWFGANPDRIQVRASRHPEEFKVGVGKFKKKQLLGSYHEKYVCVTGATYVAAVGGIDFMGDRHSPQEHGWRHDKDDCRTIAFHIYDATNNNQQEWVEDVLYDEEFMLWHDIGVKMVGQRAVHHIVEDFIRRWNAGEGDGVNIAYPFAPAAAAAGTELKIQYVKTDRLPTALVANHPRGIPAGNYPGTLNTMLQAVREARHYIYMENQYMRDQTLADAIATAMQSNAILQVMLVIPFESEEAAQIGDRHFAPAVVLQWWEIKTIQDRANIHGDYLQSKFIQKLRDVDAARVGVYGLAKWLAASEQIYPHAKTMVVDDTWAYIGSANANGRSFQLDGESGYIIHDRTIVTTYRKSLWEEHLGGASPQLETRQIRQFRTYWDGKALKAKTEPDDCSQVELANTAAVEILNPPAGQKYNGPGSWFKNLHDYL